VGRDKGRLGKWAHRDKWEVPLDKWEVPLDKWEVPLDKWEDKWEVLQDRWVKDRWVKGRWANQDKWGLNQVRVGQILLVAAANY